MSAALFSIDWAEWLNLALRWLHLTTGIAWIGSSFYFVWLDNHLKPAVHGAASGELWSVHGGGFYHNQKYQVAPPTMPDQLHWFKWEAYWTWMSGFSLLVLVYYLGARGVLIDPSRLALTQPAAIAIGLAALGGGWLIYDGLCRSPLAANPRLFGVVWFAVLVGAAWALCQVFNARGAYLHIGAMIGTVMVGNVFFVIIPNQRKVVAALKAGHVPDPARAGRAWRSWCCRWRWRWSPWLMSRWKNRQRRLPVRRPRRMPMSSRCLPDIALGAMRRTRPTPGSAKRRWVCCWTAMPMPARLRRGSNRSRSMPKSCRWAIPPA